MNLSDSPTAGLPPIERSSAAEAVFRSLRQAIGDGTLPVGTKLAAEARLAADFGVSRSVVREALRSCAALGLTRTETGRGTFVVATRPPQDLVLGAYSARDLNQARPHIEIPAAEFAAGHRTDDELAGLRRLVDAMDAEDDGEAWVELDASFHAAIADASGNAVFAKIVADIRDALTHQSETLNLVAGRRRTSNAEHRHILEAIAARDPRAAAAAMKAHLGAVRRTVTTIVEETEK
ncbi:FadR/GntR family transcriptional regulator [Zhihengliuella halotolerans]|uniref:FadR/GntR family transcriptional regulator n=1 Tax=Zhihengliuella halotolerans TaxID=370736 RepID=UPI000C7FE2A3|nr:FCD domain-containing protein [Zhihengliuella halotolerans]